MPTDQHTVATATRVLARYDAIAHDLTVRSSPVLEQHLVDAQVELLACTGLDSVDAARTFLQQYRPAAAPPPQEKPSGHRRKPSPKKKTPKKPASAKRPRLRGQDLERHTSPKRRRQALPLRMTGVVSGGLPSTGRRH